MEIDIERFINEIRRFNNSEMLLASDYVVKKHFPDNFGQLNPDNLAIQLVLLDGLWGTQLFRDAGAIEEILLALQDNWQIIHNHISQLNENSLTEDPEIMCEVAENVFTVILNIGGHHRRHYSFTTKFFHWCTCQHFPIYDKNALSGIITFLQDNQNGNVYGIQEMAPDTWAQTYCAWVRFYSDLLNYLAADNYDRILKKEDSCTQRNTNPALFVDNSLLRILDKVFYINRGQTTLSTD